MGQGFLLPLWEVAHLRLRELDVIEIALADLGYRAFDLVRRKLERSRRPAVEFFRGFVYRRIAPRLDVGEDAFDRLPHLGIGGFDRARVHSALEIAGHGSLRSLCCRPGHASTATPHRNPIVRS